MRGRKMLEGLALAGLTIWLVKEARHRAQAPPPTRTVHVVTPAAAPRAVELSRPRRSWRRRAALTLAYTALFFAGGALAAGAGNELAQVDADSTTAAVATDAAASTDATTTTTTEDTTTLDSAETTTAETVPAEQPVAAEQPEQPVEGAAPVVATPDDPPAPDADLSDAAPPAAVAAQRTQPTPTAARPRETAHRTRTATHVTDAMHAQVALPFPVISFDPHAWLVDHPGTPAGDAAVAIAKRYLGVPYVWGGSRPATGFDCSGLTQFVYAQLGVWLPHYAAAQFLAYDRVDPTQLQPGDLVFFEPKPDGPGHVALYAGGDTIVEAPHSGALVRIGSLTASALSLGFMGAVRPAAGAIAPRTLQTFAAPAAHSSAPGNWLAQAV